MLKDKKGYWLINIIVAIVFAIIALIPFVVLITMNYLSQSIFFGAIATLFIELAIMSKKNYTECKAGRKPIWG